MGNLCGRQSDDPFSHPGRTLGPSTAAPASGTSRIPAEVHQGRTLGGRSETGDARRAAAQAAEDRAARTAQQAKGRLGKELESQRQKNRKDTLEQVSRQERQFRDTDAGAAARNWD